MAIQCKVKNISVMIVPISGFNGYAYNNAMHSDGQGDDVYSFYQICRLIVFQKGKSLL